MAPSLLYTYPRYYDSNLGDTFAIPQSWVWEISVARRVPFMLEKELKMCQSKSHLSHTHQTPSNSIRYAFVIQYQHPISMLL